MCLYSAEYSRMMSPRESWSTCYPYVHLVMIGNMPISRTIRRIVSTNVLFHASTSVSTMIVHGGFHLA